MFFNIGPTTLSNFPVHYQHNNLVINLDSGWKQTTDQHNNLLLYKGYIDNGTLDDYVIEISCQEEPLYNGNFCVLKMFDQGVTVKTDRLRSFPLWYSVTDGITNLTPLDQTVWTDSFVVLADNLVLIESKFDAIGSVEESYLTLDQVVEQVDTILYNKIKQFAKHNSEPINVFLSGGIDTMLLYSYVKRLNIPHNLIACAHTDYDYFYLKNHDTLSQFWGYRQFHYWDQDCILLSGAPGDEFTVRSPATANMMMRFHGTSIPELMQQSEHRTALHYLYFNKPDYMKMWNNQTETYNSLSDAIRACLNFNINDWQHWHLGRTISYTPLRDLDIFKTIARLGKHDLIDQVMDSIVQKTLLKNNAPELLLGLSAQKNSKNSMENLTGILIDQM
jgi:hypothetical protein